MLNFVGGSELTKSELVINTARLLGYDTMVSGSIENYGWVFEPKGRILIGGDYSSQVYELLSSREVIEHMNMVYGITFDGLFL